MPFKLIAPCLCLLARYGTRQGRLLGDAHVCHGQPGGAGKHTANSACSLNHYGLQPGMAWAMPLCSLHLSTPSPMTLPPQALTHVGMWRVGLGTSGWEARG